MNALERIGHDLERVSKTIQYLGAHGESGARHRASPQEIMRCLEDVGALREKLILARERARRA